MFAGGQPFARFSGHSDVVTCLARCVADNHLEKERILLGSLANLDHISLLDTGSAGLRAHRERPRRRAAEQADELASP
jgi:hypothetical protein